MNKVLRLLLVEDSQKDARVLRELLRDVEPLPEPQITHVSDLASAVHAAAANTYDCVLLDMNLPDGDGVGNVDRIREAQPGLTIVVLTGNEDQQSALAAISRGAQEYAVKGRHGGYELLLLIRHAVERNRLLAEMELQRQREYHRATHDALTGIPNRQLFQDRVRMAISNGQRNGKQPVVCFLDLDGFKPVNDQHGHAIGDALLCEVSRRLAGTVRDGDTVARLGGDEFAVLLSDVGRQDEAAAAASRLVNAVAGITEVEGIAVRVGVSAGLARYPSDGQDVEQLLTSADRAMYRAKAAGKGQWQFASGIPEEHFEPAPAPVGSFDPGILHLQFQPWYSITSGSCLGMEALVRLQGGDHAEPALARARASQALPQLGAWVLRQACGEWLAVASRMGSEARLAINVATEELERRDYACSTLRLLKSLGMSPSALQLEVAEHSLAEASDGGTALSNLIALRREGVRIALDQFGRHEASLARLAELPVDVIKLDGRYARALRNEAPARAFVAGVSGYAAALQREVVICGLESAHDLDLLRSLPPMHAQGFALASPTRREAVAARLTL